VAPHLSPRSVPSSPSLSLSLFSARFLPIVSSRLRGCILKFSALYYHISSAMVLPSPSPRFCRRRCDAKVPQQTRRFFSRHPVYPVYFVREAHRCVRRVNVRPSPHATDRRASYAPTHRSPVCFGFPGVTRTPHFSPVTSTSLSLSLFLSLLSFSLPYSPIPVCSCSLSLSLSLSFLFRIARYIPMSVKPIAAWNDGVVPKWGLRVGGQ